MERCESGLIDYLGKVACRQLHRGFESLSLRKFQISAVFIEQTPPKEFYNSNCGRTLYYKELNKLILLVE